MFNDNNILDAVFTNAENDTIAVIYRDEEAGENQEIVIQVNENDATYQALVAAGWDTDKVTESTAERKKEYMRDVYNTLRAQHEETYNLVIEQLEAEKQQRVAKIQEEIDAIQAAYDLKQEQFKLAVAAIDAVKKEYNIVYDEK